MPCPDIDELDVAYESGRTAAPDARNPYFIGTPLWMQWNFGRGDNPNPSNRFAIAGRIVLVASIAGMALALGRAALL